MAIQRQLLTVLSAASVLSLALSAVFLLPGCASQNTASLRNQISPTVTPELYQSVLIQEEAWYKDLKGGQSLADVTFPALVPEQSRTLPSSQMPEQYLLENAQDQSLHQYIQGRYPVTQHLYGLYFIDNKLMGLLLDRDAFNFRVCEEFYRHGGYPPAYTKSKLPPYRIEPVIGWVEKHSKLGGPIDLRPLYTPSHSLDGEPLQNESVSVNAAEVVTHIPIAAIALPFYGASKIPVVRGLIDRQEKKRKRRLHQWFDLASDVHPGALTEGGLLKLMGPPVSKFRWPGGSGWRYNWPGDDIQLHFGIKDGRVNWKMYAAMKSREFTYVNYGHVDCSEMFSQ